MVTSSWNSPRCRFACSRWSLAWSSVAVSEATAAAWRRILWARLEEASAGLWKRVMGSRDLGCELLVNMVVLGLGVMVGVGEEGGETYEAEDHIETSFDWRVDDVSGYVFCVVYCDVFVVCFDSRGKVR